MGKSDKDFAKLLKLMQRQGEANNPTGLEVGVMNSSNTCSIGDLELDKDDILLNSSLKGNLKKGDTVVAMQLGDQDMYVILCKVVDA